MVDPAVDAIKSRVDIAELIGARVTLRRAGKLLKGLCPFHQEKSPSFVVYPDEGRYHCFGCAKSGDVFTWLRDTQGLDFAEALQELSRRTGVALLERTARPQTLPSPETQAAVQALSDASRFYTRQLFEAPEGGEARAYLRRRGVTRATVEQFAIGWAPDSREALTEHLARKGFTLAQLELCGLAMVTEHGRRDRFRGRIMFPIRDRTGQVTGFGGRTLGDGQPKYLNSPETPFFDKGATLYGIDLARGDIRRERQAVIVEGYMDVVVPHQEGFKNVVAALGTAMTERQITELRRYTQTIVLALDADAAGQAATLRGLEVARTALGTSQRPAPGSVARGGFLATQAGQVRIAILTGGKDPDEIVRDDPERWRAIIDGAVPMMDHKISIETESVPLDDPSAKLRAVRELARFLALVPDPIEWSHYIDRIAQRLRLDVRAVHAEVRLAESSLRQAERLARLPSPVVRSSSVAPNLAVEAPPSPDATTPTSVPQVLEPVDDPLERYVIGEIADAPDLLTHVRHVISADDFRRSEWRALFERLETSEDPRDVPSEGPLLAVRDELLADTGRRPRDVSVEDADEVRVIALVRASRRLRERRLREKIRDAQYLMEEGPSDEERIMLRRLVQLLAGQLGRVHIEQSRI